MDTIIGIIAFILVLGVIIAVHEAGHFFFARRVNVLCRDFAFGMGPILWKKKKGETLYSIRAFPIGGFCSIAGEEVEDDPFKGRKTIRLNIVDNVIKGFYLDSDSKVFSEYKEYNIVSYDIFDSKETGNLYMEVSNESETIRFTVDPKAMLYMGKMEIQIAPYNRTIGSKTKRARAMVMFGGPMMNFILALVVFFIAGLIQGYPDYKTATVADMTEGTPAYDGGLRDGDVITNLKSGSLTLDIKEWDDISKFMDSYENLNSLDSIIVTYTRDNASYNASISPEVVIYNIGIGSDYTTSRVIIGALAEYNNNMCNNKEIKLGDEILEINGNKVTNWMDVYKVFSNYEGLNDELVTLKVNRDNKELDVSVKPFSKKVMDTQTTTSGTVIPPSTIIMGVSPAYKFSFLKSFAYSGSRTIGSFTAVIDTFDLLFSGDAGVQNLSGPVGIFSLTKNVASQGFAPLLNLTGLLSVNIGLLNLLPIPALDGGRLVFLAYEAITKKKPNQKVETILITVTMLLLFGLMIFVTFEDILRLIGIRG